MVPPCSEPDGDCPARRRPPRLRRAGERRDHWWSPRSGLMGHRRPHRRWRLTWVRLRLSAVHRRHWPRHRSWSWRCSEPVRPSTTAVALDAKEETAPEREPARCHGPPMPTDMRDVTAVSDLVRGIVAEVVGSALRAALRRGLAGPAPLDDRAEESGNVRSTGRCRPHRGAVEPRQRTWRSTAGVDHQHRPCRRAVRAAVLTTIGLLANSTAEAATTR